MKVTDQRARLIRLRLTVIAPPIGVRWAVQLGRDGLLAPIAASADRVIFDVPLELVASSNGITRLRGAAMQGPPNARFLYLNSGTRAGELRSCWDRRAKVSLASIPVEQLQNQPHGRALILEGEIDGRAKDGGPACASVPLLRAAWVVG